MQRRQENLSRIIVKAMGLFGGVQVLGILCSIVRSKCVAEWIGPVGVGLFGLWNVALEMISAITNLGVRSSSVREISAHVATGEQDKIARIVTVVRRWSMWLGISGALLTVAFAPALSKITFGDYNHIWGFIVLSVSVMMVTLMNGEHAILQGTAKLKRLARASVWGSLAGLVVNVPMYYFLRVDSVLPSILVYSIVGTLAAYLYRNKDFAAVEMSRSEVVSQGKEFIRLGIYMTLGSFFALVSSYVFMAYLNWCGGTEQVGYYQAGYTLVNKYVGLVLTALAVEFFPRLSKVSHSHNRMGIFVTQEINITLLVLTPIVLAFMLMRGYIVELLYAEGFGVIVSYVSWLLVGMLLRATSWCMAYVILAKGDGKVYIVTEALSTLIGLLMNIVSYHYWGLNGLGVSFVVWYAFYNIIVGVVYFGRYKMRLSKNAILMTAYVMMFALSSVFAMECEMEYIVLILTLISAVVSIRGMQKLLKRKAGK